MRLSTLLCSAALLVSEVTAHGYVPWIRINGQTIAGWNVNTDGYTTPQPIRVVRPTKPDSGFISDPSSNDITCSIGNSKLPPGPITATVAAGSTVQIQQSVYQNGEWASDTLAKSNFTYNVRIPSNIAPGAYLLRHENLALHGAANLGGAQFYPVCIQLTVTGGGSLKPSGLSFPGTYKATDPGIYFNVYQGDAANKAYVPPGGSVYPGLT
ncbi:hypothetical protein D9756_008559 [Leucocoprinus leucothites]|uniref:lytic cellulose monooxygenase (C4-dehydrogenating) n=1 Tax=Leucocoprinus leucothites TaxID=201217 RepID=A0A8H5D0M8_9AGAR|nr:hypothetical protein D9756_008559 [Leucoagaricus leucothites]